MSKKLEFHELTMRAREALTKLYGAAPGEAAQNRNHDKWNVAAEHWHDLAENAHQSVAELEEFVTKAAEYQRDSAKDSRRYVNAEIEAKMPTFGAKLEEVVVHGAPDAAERAEKLLFEMADLRFKAGLPAMVLAAAAGLGAWEYHNGSSEQSARAVPSRRRQL